MDFTRMIRHGWWASALLAMSTLAPAVAQNASEWPVPRHAEFRLDPGSSQVELSLFTGGVQAKLKGAIKLFLGDPRVPVPFMNPLGDWVGLSVEGADFLEVRATTDPSTRPLMHLVLDPKVFCTGFWNTNTYQISFRLSLTTPGGPLPVPQPVYLTGVLATYTDAATTPVLSVEGSNGNIPDATMKLTLRGYEVPPPPPPPGVEIWFSTRAGFTAGLLDPSGTVPVRVSGGDLLSQKGYIARRNADLVGRLGIMPMVPDLGLDAAMLGPQGVVWFSIDAANAPIWSETMGRWLKHGDLLAETGHVVRTNEQLLAAFLPVVTNTTPGSTKWDAGLDAVAQAAMLNTAARRSLLFSTEQRFFSRRLNTWVGPGDLLSEHGYIVKRNRDLLRNFHPVQMDASVLPADYGLDAIVLRPNGEVWFSTETGFQDAQLGPISDGDLLSTTGRVVVRNLDMLSAFGPLEDAANFGLDAAMLIVPVAAADTYAEPPTANTTESLAQPMGKMSVSGAMMAPAQ